MTITVETAFFWQGVCYITTDKPQTRILKNSNVELADNLDSFSIKLIGIQQANSNENEPNVILWMFIDVLSGDDVRWRD